MLVLTRKMQESVVVGGCKGFELMLTVTVLEIEGGKVRLGFAVDKDVPVHRWEVWQRILAVNGKEVDGRALTVNEARPKTEGGGGRGGRGGSGGGYGGGRRY